MNEILFDELYPFSVKKSYRIVSNLRCIEKGLIYEFKCRVNEEQRECLSRIVNCYFPTLKISIKKDIFKIKPMKIIPLFPSSMIYKNDGTGKCRYEYVFYVRIYDIPFDFMHENVISHIHQSCVEINILDYLSSLNSLKNMNYHVRIIKQNPSQ